MALTEKLSVALPADMADLVREAVEKGEYASAGEIVREALDDWRRRRDERRRALDELGALWDAGIASGPAEDIETAFAWIGEQLEAAVRERDVA